MIKQKIEDEFMRQSRGAWGLVPCRGKSIVQSVGSRKELSALMGMYEGCCDFCTKSQGMGMERDAG